MPLQIVKHGHVWSKSVMGQKKDNSEGKNHLEEYIEERFSRSSFATFQESSKMTEVPSILTCMMSDSISGQPSQVNAGSR